MDFKFVASHRTLAGGVQRNFLVQRKIRECKTLRLTDSLHEIAHLHCVQRNRFVRFRAQPPADVHAHEMTSIARFHEQSRRYDDAKIAVQDADSSAKKYRIVDNPVPEWSTRSCLASAAFLWRAILHPGVGLADGGAPRDVPVEQIPFELRMPNTPLWIHFDEEWNILRVWRREE